MTLDWMDWITDKFVSSFKKSGGKGCLQICGIYHGMFYGAGVDKAMDVSHPSLKSSKSYRVRQGVVERREIHLFW